MGDRKVLRTYSNAAYSIDSASYYALRLYDSSIKEDELGMEIQVGFRDNLNKLSLEEKLKVYDALRTKALVGEVTGNNAERDRHLEAALYFMVNFI